MIREARSALDKWLSGKVAPTVLALLSVGATGSGIGMARSLDTLTEKVDQIQRQHVQRNRQQDARIDRHDDRITYLERMRSDRADAGVYADAKGGSGDE